MEAIFNNNPAELEAAADRAGLVVVSGPMDDPDGCCVSIHRAELPILGNTEYFAVRGTTHAVMRIVGALADDGQDTLVSARLSS